MLFPNCTINIDPGPGNMSVDVTRPAGPGRCAGSTEYFYYEEVSDETAAEMMAFANQVGTRGRLARRLRAGRALTPG